MGEVGVQTGLAEWLLAQVQADERIAREVGHDDIGEWIDEALADIGDVRFVQRFDPARVLVECDTKRRIIAQHQTVPVAPGRREVTCLEDGSTSWPCPTLRLLALPYVDRPGYRPEWAPDGR